MRILPGLTVSSAAATVKKGTYSISTRVLPTAGSVFTPLKAPTRTVTNPILTGPFISTQERATATKNILTSVTQKPAVGPLILPKPYVTPKPVVQKNLTPVVPKPSIPFRGRPLVTPVEQQRMKAVAPSIVTRPTIAPAVFQGRPTVTAAEQIRMSQSASRGQSNSNLYSPSNSVPIQEQSFGALGKAVSKDAAIAFDLWNAQGSKGVNGIIYWVNDLLIKTGAPVIGKKDYAEENRKYAALQMDLASEKERALMASIQNSTWDSTVVTAINGGLSLLQSLAMGFATQGGQLAGQFLADRLKEGGAIAIGQLARTQGYKAAIAAVKNAISVSGSRVGVSVAASVMPAWISSGIEGGSIYRELTDMGKSPARASAAALASIAGTALSESIELAGMYRTWGKNVHAELAARLTNALRQATSETVQELGQNLWQNGVRMIIGQDDTQKLATVKETIDTIIGIFPSSFLFGAGTFNAQVFRQQNATEVGRVTAMIEHTFDVDSKTADLMLDEAITKWGPTVRDVFLSGIDTRKVKIAETLDFMQSTDPYVKWLVGDLTKLGVPVGQPVTTQQTVAPAPVRTAIPAQATAPVSRILPHATEAPAVSSPVVPISTRRLPVSTPAAPTTQPAAAATKQPYSVDLPDGSRLTITPPAAQVAPTVPVTEKQPWQMTQDEYMNRRTIPAMQGKLPETGTHPAVETVDGSIFADASDTPATHVQMIRDLGIPPERLKSGGWIVDGVYEPTARSDTMKYAEQEQAKTRVEQKQAIRRAISEGKDVPSEVLSSYPDLKTSPSAAISNQETGATTPVEATAPVVAPAVEVAPTGRYGALTHIVNQVPTSFVARASDTRTDLTESISPEQMVELTADIKKNGIQTPFILEYNPETGFVKMVEGIHRLRAAQELGIESLPVTMVRAEAPVTDTNLNIGKYTGNEYLERQFAPSFLKEIPIVAPSQNAPAAKEPWQMTLDEIAATGTIAYDTKVDHYIFVPGVSKIAPDSNAHFQAVRKAIAEGKVVPSEVLAEYPDLKATAPAAVTPAVTTDPLTGLGTPEAWQTADKTDKIVATIDMNALLTNSKQYGPDFGNTLRVIVAGALQQEGIQGYGLNKIEVAALFPSQEEADAKMAAVQKVIQETAVNATVDGKTTTLTGWRLDYGAGDDKESADAALAASRTDNARSRWNVQPVRSPAGVAKKRQGDAYATNLAVGIRPEPSSQQQIAKNNATPWVELGIQPTPRELLNGVTALGYTLSESSRQMFDPKELNKLPMLQKLFRKSGTKVVGLDELASVLFSEYGINRPQGDLQADDWLAQQLVAGASKGAGNATKDLFGGEIRTRTTAPTEATDTELFGKGQKAAFTTAQKNAAERGRHLQGQDQARVPQGQREGMFAPTEEVLPGEFAEPGFNAPNANLGTNTNTTGTQANQPTTAGYEMNVTPSTGTTARTIAAENIQKVALAVKDYVTTLAHHPGMKESDYHAQLQDRLKQLGVPAGLFTPTEILKMYQASKGPSQLWNLTNRVLMKLNAYNAAQMDLAGALNTIPSSVLTKGQKRTLQDATLDNADLMRSLNFIDKELTKAQVTADLREKFDDMLAAQKEKDAVRLAKMAHRVDAAKLQAEEKAAAKDSALKDKAIRDKTVLQINRSLAAVENNVKSGHTIALDYVDKIRDIVKGLTTGNKLMAKAAADMSTSTLQTIADAIKVQIAVGRMVHMADVTVRKQEIADTVARLDLKPMAGYPTKTLNHLTYAAVVSRYGRVRNAAATMGQGITPAETIHRMLGLREMYMDFLGGLTDARQLTDSWRKERLDKAKELGIATDLQQRRIGIWLINQTPGGRNHMIEGNKLTEHDIDDIVLTPQEQQYASFMRDHFDKNFPALRDYFRDFYNIEVTPVDAYTSLFNSSEFESDYEKAMKNLTFQNAVSGQRKTPKVGMAIKRTGGDNPVEINIFHIGDTYDDTLGYAMEFGPRLQKWWGVATNEEVMSKLGDLGNIYIRKNLVNLTYRGGPGGRTAESAMDKAADWLRRNLSRGQILLRPTSALLQALQISNVAGITGQNFVVKAGALLTSDEKYGQWVKENFPLLRDSVRNYFEILGLPDDKMTQITGAMFRWCHDAARTTGAIANYLYVCQQAGIPVDWEHPDKDLLLEAMVMVNQEFGSEDIVSLPAALETGYGFGDDKSLARLILQFQQDTLARFDVLKTKIPGFKHKDAKRAIRALFWMLLVGTGLVAGARYGYRKILKTVLEAKQQESDTYLAEYLKDIFEAVPFGNSIQSIFSYGDVPVPALSTLVDAATQAKNLITYQGGYAKLRAGIRLATDIGSTLISAPGIGTIGQALGYMVPSSTSSSGSTTIKKPTKPTPAVQKPHK